VGPLHLGIPFLNSTSPHRKRDATQPNSGTAMPPSPATPSSGSSRFASVLLPFRRMATDVCRSLTAASYPIRGIWYFLRHPEFYPLFVGRLLPLSIISFLVYFLLFTFAFLPQLLFLAIFHGSGAVFATTVLVLGEGLVIIQGLFEGFFVDECRVDIFDVSRILPSLFPYQLLPLLLLSLLFRLYVLFSRRFVCLAFFHLLFLFLLSALSFCSWWETANALVTRRP
jgi:hypothetical protein